MKYSRFVVKDSQGNYVSPDGSMTDDIQSAYRFLKEEISRNRSLDGMENIPFNTIEDLLEDITVHSPGQWENDEGPEGWWAVSTEFDGGICGYFQHEEQAYGFRMFLINMILNNDCVNPKG